MTRGVVRTLVAVAVAALATPAGVALLASPASAHASQVRVEPGEGSTVTTAPRTVRLVFDENVRNPAAVVVRGPAGRVDAGKAQAVDNTVSVGVQLSPDPQDVGRYTVAYRVVSADGHPVSGESTFEYRPPGVTAAPASQTGSQGTSQSDSRPSQAHSSRSLWLVGAVVAAVVAAAALLLAPRRRR